MKPTTCVLSAMLLLLTALLAMPAMAQDGGATDEEAALDLLAEAYANFRQLKTYSLTMENELFQEITSPTQANMVVEMTMTQAAEGVAIQGTEGETNASSQVLDQELVMEIPGLPTTEQTMTMETIIVDGSYYLRVPEAEGEGTENLPRDWVNVSENPRAVPGLETLNIDAVADLASTSIPFVEVDGDTVASIRVLEPDEIDGQEMTVIEVVWDNEAVLENDAFGLSAQLNFEALGLNTEDFIRQFIENSTITQRVWIGAEDTLPHQVETEMVVFLQLDASATGSVPIDLEQTIVTLVTVSDFNVPVTIEAPIED